MQSNVVPFDVPDVVVAATDKDRDILRGVDLPFLNELLEESETEALRVEVFDAGYLLEKVEEFRLTH